MNQPVSKSARRRERRRRAKKVEINPGEIAEELKPRKSLEGDLSLAEQIRMSEAIDDIEPDPEPEFISTVEHTDDGGAIAHLRLEPRHSELLRQLSDLSGTAEPDACLVILKAGLIARKAEIRDKLGMGGATTRAAQPTE